MVTDQSPLVPVTQPTPATAVPPATDAVISIQGITKRFGVTPSSGRHFRRAPWKDIRRARAFRHGQVRPVEDCDRASSTRGRPGVHRRGSHRRCAREGGPADPAEDRCALPGRRPLRIDEPLRQHRFPLVEHTSKTDKEIREIVLAKSELVGLGRPPSQAARRGVRRHAQASGPGPGPRARTSDPLLRRTGLGTRSGHGSPISTTLINTVHEETGSTFFIISHNIESVKRTAHYLGLLFRTRLVGFGSKEEMTTSRGPVIQQFLAGRPEGPISMDEMADEVDLGESPLSESGAPTVATDTAAVPEDILTGPTIAT
jgi:hypothetical protein